MDAAVAVPALAVMLVGVAGIVLPVLPGLALIWLAGIGSMVVAGWSAGAWVTAAVLTALAGGAQVAQYVLPARAGRTAGAPRSSLLAGAACGAVGFFVVPVVGFFLGGVAGVYLAERSRLGGHDAAWRTTWSVVRSIGIAVVIQLVAGVLMIAAWLAHVLW